MAKKTRRLASIIKRKKKEVSIVPFIDSQLGKPPTKFSAEDIHESLKDLTALASDATHDWEKHEQGFWKAFLSAYDKVYAPTYRAEAKIHPSSLRFSCPRAVFYELTHITPTNPENGSIDPRLQRIFDTGTWWHTYIQNILDKSGILKGREVPVVDKDRWINGKADGVIEFPTSKRKLLLEIKTINSFAYGRLGGPKEDHLFQASIYASILGLKEIVFLYINKDTCEFKEYICPTNAELLEEANSKISRIQGCIRRERPPARICSSEKDKTAINCEFCNHCFKK
jgi:hypothetical protein